MVEEPHLGVDDVGQGYARKGRAVGPAGGRVDGGRTGRPVAAAHVVDAQHREPAAVERLARPDEAVPPARLNLRGPPIPDARHGRIEPGGVLAAGEGMEDQDHVVARLVHLPVQLVGERVGPQRRSLPPGEWFVEGDELRLGDAHRGGGQGHGRAGPRI